MGNLAKECQEHEGAKDANTLYVQYNRDTTAASGAFTKALRLTNTRYPNGWLVHATYGTEGQPHDIANQIAAIHADNSGTPGAALAEYTHLGGPADRGGLARAAVRQLEARLD